MALENFETPEKIEKLFQFKLKFKKFNPEFPTTNRAVEIQRMETSAKLPESFQRICL